jgi:hypothetical protein
MASLTAIRVSFLKAWLNPWGPYSKIVYRGGTLYRQTTKGDINMDKAKL